MYIQSHQIANRTNPPRPPRLLPSAHLHPCRPLKETDIYFNTFKKTFAILYWSLFCIGRYFVMFAVLLTAVLLFRCLVISLFCYSLDCIHSISPLSLILETNIPPPQSPLPLLQPPPPPASFIPPPPPPLASSSPPFNYPHSSSFSMRILSPACHSIIPLVPREGG